MNKLFLLIAFACLSAGCTITVDPTIMDGFLPPRLISGYNPLWVQACPDEVMVDGEKAATFRFTLDENGKAQDVTLVQKTNDCFAEAGEKELKKWVFAPAEVSGRRIDNVIYMLNFIYDDTPLVMKVIVDRDSDTGEINRVRLEPED